MENIWDNSQMLSRHKQRSGVAPGKIQAVVVDSVSGCLEILEVLSKFEESVEVIGRATNTADAVGLIAKAEPDLIIMDAAVPLGNAVALAGVLCDCLPDALIILTSNWDTARQRARCLSSAHAFVSKQRLDDELAEVLVARFHLRIDVVSTEADCVELSSLDS
jgi:DNA-binding NarL/FixJ family response regulator